MSINSKRQAGFTLIELIMFIVVVGIGVVGILSVMNFTVLHSADPMVRKQAAALADSIMEEILLKDYTDPDSTETGETGRSTYDDVDDYNGLTQTAFTDLPALLQTYGISIAVADATATLGVTAKKVTVTVTGGAETISMTGYRANY